MKTPPLLLAVLLAGCAGSPSAAPAAAAPPSASSPAAAAPGPLTAPSPEDAAPVMGRRAPAFRFPALADRREVSLEDALALQGGRPLVLVLGAVACSISTAQVEEMAEAGLPGPGTKDAGYLAVMTGDPDEVAMAVPGTAAFPILLAGDADVLDRYRVVATPSIVVLDGKGRIAYIGDGGHLDLAVVRDLAARAARGEAIDPATVHPVGG